MKHAALAVPPQAIVRCSRLQPTSRSCWRNMAVPAATFPGTHFSSRESRVPLAVGICSCSGCLTSWWFSSNMRATVSLRTRFWLHQLFSFLQAPMPHVPHSGTLTYTAKRSLTRSAENVVLFPNYIPTAPVTMCVTGSWQLPQSTVMRGLRHGRCGRVLAMTAATTSGGLCTLCISTLSFDQPDIRQSPEPTQQL